MHEEEDAQQGPRSEKNRKTTTRYATAVGIVTLMLITTGCQQQLPQPLLDDVNAVRATNFDAACINVARQVDAKRITMFAVVPVDPSTKEIDGYHIEVVVNPTIIREHREFCGAYHNHHNGLVLEFASVQVLDGNRDLGLYLIQTLANINPNYEESAPGQRNRPIQRILGGIEANDGSMQDFLEDEKLNWEHRVKEHKTPDIMPPQ